MGRRVCTVQAVVSEAVPASPLFTGGSRRQKESLPPAEFPEETGTMHARGRPGSPVKQVVVPENRMQVGILREE